VKKFFNQIALFIGLLLVSYPYLVNKIPFFPQFSFNLPQTPTDAQEWTVKPGSIYDGDTLRVVRGNEELKIRFCGIDAPELDQPLGIESRDYLRTRGTSEPLAYCPW
jgi:endonuclease YncB( thermonuclease family)